MGGTVVKRNVFVIVICGLIIVFLILFNMCITEYKLEIEYVGSIPQRDEGIGVAIIKTQKELENLALTEIDVDINEKTLIISHGKKIDKVIFKKRKKIFKSHFIEVYLRGEEKDSNVYIYTTSEKEIYFDERLNNN